MWLVRISTHHAASGLAVGVALPLRKQGSSLYGSYEMAMRSRLPRDPGAGPCLNGEQFFSKTYFHVCLTRSRPYLCLITHTDTAHARTLSISGARPTWRSSARPRGAHRAPWHWRGPHSRLTPRIHAARPRVPTPQAHLSAHQALPSPQLGTRIVAETQLHGFCPAAARVRERGELGFQRRSIAQRRSPVPVRR